MQSIRIPLAAAAAALLSLSPAWAPTAEACSFAFPEDHTLDPEEQAIDQTPPQPPQIVDPHLVRRSPEGPGCGVATSCDGSASVVLSVTATDDRTPGSEMGYVLRLVDGELPEGLTLPAGPVRTLFGGEELALVFNDRDQPVSFTLSVRAVDLAGNEGPAVEVLFADDPGGCRAGGAGTTWAALLLLAAIALATRRRRRHA